MGIFQYINGLILSSIQRILLFIITMSFFCFKQIKTQLKTTKNKFNSWRNYHTFRIVEKNAIFKTIKIQPKNNNFILAKEELVVFNQWNTIVMRLYFSNLLKYSCLNLEFTFKKK